MERSIAGSRRSLKRKFKIMEDKNRSYEELVSELEKLVAGIEDPGKSLSEVSKDVGRAVALLALCRAKLRESECQVKDILENI
jgi:exodeoxyribonuclease VII small subunit